MAKYSTFTRRNIMVSIDSLVNGMGYIHSNTVAAGIEAFEALGKNDEERLINLPKGEFYLNVTGTPGDQIVNYLVKDSNNNVWGLRFTDSNTFQDIDGTAVSAAQVIFTQEEGEDDFFFPQFTPENCKEVFQLDFHCWEHVA